MGEPIMGRGGLLDSLNNLELAIKAIETIRGHGFSLIPLTIDGEHRIKMTAIKAGIEPDDRELMRMTLLRNKPTIEAITKNHDSIRETLSDAQEALSENNRVFSVDLDLWARLEKIFRAVFPDDLSCINGDKGCSGEAVANCTACVKG